MPTEKEITIIQKATIYDLQKLLERGDPEKRYSAEELKSLMDAYLTGPTT